MPDLDPTSAERDEIARSARRKVAWHILPLLFLLYVIAYLDRANLGFAKLRLLDDLKFSETIYGWGVAMFFIGYMFLEIPGALLVERWSARKWFTRILISWGVVSMGMALVQTPLQFYIARFLLGLAEAGFFPGVIVYFTHWFPRKDRARAMSVMLIGVPLSLALGAPVSALLLEQTWFDLKGWQWVFLVEGAPAVLLGIALPFLLPDRPRDAKWLTPAERDWLESTLEAERRETSAVVPVSLWQVFGLWNVWFLALALLATNIGGYVFVFWLATVVKGLLSATGGAIDNTTVLLWTGLVYLCGVVGVILSGWSSDRTGDRKGHCITGQLGAAVFLTLCMIPGQPWGMVFFWLCLTGFFANFWFSSFWVLPTMTLTASAAAVAIATINMSGNMAGAIGSPVVGKIKDACTRFNLTDDSFTALHTVKVPETVLVKLTPLKDKEFRSREEFMREIATVLDADESKTFKDLILKHSDASFGDRASMLFVAISFTLGAVFVAMVRLPKKRETGGT